MEQFQSIYIGARQLMMLAVPIFYGIYLSGKPKFEWVFFKRGFVVALIVSFIQKAFNVATGYLYTQHVFGDRPFSIITPFTMIFFVLTVQIGLFAVFKIFARKPPIWESAFGYGLGFYSGIIAWGAIYTLWSLLKYPAGPFLLNLLTIFQFLEFIVRSLLQPLIFVAFGFLIHRAVIERKILFLILSMLIHSLMAGFGIVLEHIRAHLYDSFPKMSFDIPMICCQILLYGVLGGVAIWYIISEKKNLEQVDQKGA